MPDLPPGPRLPLAAQSLMFAHRPIDFLRRCRRRYGKVFTVNIAPFGRVVYVTTPEGLRTLFSGNRDEILGGRPRRPLAIVNGDESVLVLDGDRHRRARKLLGTPFSADHAREHTELIAQLTERAMREWPVGRPFALAPELRRLTLEILLRTVYGLEDQARIRLFAERLPAVMEASPLLLWYPPLQRDLLGAGPWARYNRRREEINSMLYELLEERAARPADGGARDVLSLLLRARDDEGNPMSRQELRDQLFTILTTGHETTATALSWAFERLTREPEVVARVREEIAAGEGDEYLDAVAREVLRIRPVVLDVTRHLTAPLTVEGWRLPAGTTVTAALGLVQLAEEVWPEPDAFRPERFLEARPRPNTWVPFGGGDRRCIGGSFAMLEIKAVLRTVLPRVDMRPASPRPEGPTIRNVTVLPARGARVVVDRFVEAPAAARQGDPVAA